MAIADDEDAFAVQRTRRDIESNDDKKCKSHKGNKSQ